VWLLTDDVPNFEPDEVHCVRHSDRWQGESAAGLPPLPFHYLRHTFATLAMRGLDPATCSLFRPLEDHYD
jgi:integrase